MQKFIYSFCFIFLILLFVFSNNTSALNRNEFYAQGVSPIAGNNMTLARTKALEDFKQQIIMQAILQIAGPSILDSNKEIVQKEFFTKTDNYIKSFRILAENASDGIYRISGEATVTVQKLKEDLATLGIITPVENSEVEKKTTASVISWISNSSCHLKIGNDMAADFFDETIIARLAENGWTVLKNGESQRAEEAYPVYLVRNNFSCQQKMIQCRIEIRNASTGNVKGVISESVMMDSETPVLESVLTLIELVSPQVIDLIGKGSNTIGVISQKQEEYSPFWTIEIVNSPDYSGWEKIEAGLREQNINFRIKEIVQDVQSISVKLEGAPDSIGDYLDGLVLDTGSKVIVKNLDPYNRRILVSIQPSEGSESR